MREYKHRGKCINEGELKGKWVYGDLLQKNGKYYITPHANAVNVQGNLGKIIIMHEVDPETVGQYTGLKDKHGNKVYTGDFLRDRESYDEIYYYEVIWSESNACFYFKDIFSADYFGGEDIEWSQTEHIGNRWDNPELLEGTGC